MWGGCWRSWGDESGLLMMHATPGSKLAATREALSARVPLRMALLHQKVVHIFPSERRGWVMLCVCLSVLAVPLTVAVIAGRRLEAGVGTGRLIGCCAVQGCLVNDLNSNVALPIIIL